MTVNDWLNKATQKLIQAGIGTARLDALVLLEDTLNKNRTHLLAHPELELTANQQNVLSDKIKRRSQHEPLAYIRGQTEFYGRDFFITPAVLEPRPESETMIDLLKKILHHPTSSSEAHTQVNMETGPIVELSNAQLDPRRKIHIADVGTGSGALGITAILEVAATVDLLEIDDSAIEIAKKNVIKLSTANQVIKSDLLSKTAHPYDILLCNLPYVPDGFAINPAAMNEPRIAIFGGPDGLDIYRRLFKQLQTMSWKPAYIFTEALPPQHTILTRLAERAGYHLAQAEGFIQVFTPS